MNTALTSYPLKKNLPKEEALQAACEQERKQKEVEAEIEKLHLKLRKNKEFMSLQVKDLDSYVYVCAEEETPICKMLGKLKAASAKRKVHTTPYETKEEIYSNRYD